MLLAGAGQCWRKPRTRCAARPGGRGACAATSACSNTRRVAGAASLPRPTTWRARRVEPRCCSPTRIGSTRPSKRSRARISAAMPPPPTTSGVLLEERGDDRVGAEAAYRRADERGDRRRRVRARRCCLSGRVGLAESRRRARARRRARPCRRPPQSSARCSTSGGDADGRRLAAYHRADERGEMPRRIELAMLLVGADRLDKGRGRDALARAAERGHPDALPRRPRRAARTPPGPDRDGAGRRGGGRRQPGRTCGRAAPSPAGPEPSDRPTLIDDRTDAAR